MATPAPLSKYRAIPTRGYASKREANRARELYLLAQAGLISDLREQVKFELIPRQDDEATGRCIERATNYIADFTYHDEHGRYVVEDCKGIRTPIYIMKRKLMLLVHKIRVRET